MLAYHGALAWEAMDEREEEAAGSVDPHDADEEPDIPAPPTGLGALGQLAMAVIVVALLLAAFIFGSAFLRRLFG